MEHPDMKVDKQEAIRRAVEVVRANMKLRLAQGFGEEVSQEEWEKAYRDGYDVLFPLYQKAVNEHDGSNDGFDKLTPEEAQLCIAAYEVAQVWQDLQENWLGTYFEASKDGIDRFVAHIDGPVARIESKFLILAKVVQ